MNAVVNFLIEIVSKNHYVKRKFGQVHSVVDALVSLDTQFQKALADGKMSKAEASRIEGRLASKLFSLSQVLPPTLLCLYGLEISLKSHIYIIGLNGLTVSRYS
jgi:hypothetical protein